VIPRQDDNVLEDVVAWLVINSLKSEQTQRTMLFIQNISNLYRKNAFKCFHRHIYGLIEATTLTSVSLNVASESDDGFIHTLSWDASSKVFDEPIDFSLEAGVPLSRFLILSNLSMLSLPSVSFSSSTPLRRHCAREWNLLSFINGL